MAQRDAVQWGVRYENSRGEVKERFFDTKHGMQGWLSTVGDQVKLLALSIYRVPETSDRKFLGLLDARDSWRGTLAALVSPAL